VRGRSRWACVALALGLATTAVAACTTSSSPPVESTTSASTATSSSATSTSTTASTTTTTFVGSDIPEAARENTADGAVSFTGFFAQRANQAYSELNPDLITSLSQDSCGTCRAMVEAINGWRSKNQRYQGQFINPVASTISAFPNDGTAKVLVTSRTSGGRIVDANGSVSSTFASESGNVSISLARVNDGWSVTSIKGSA
jgi:hypothetical protein